jgi:hypothetical protein
VRSSSQTAPGAPLVAAALLLLSFPSYASSPEPAFAGAASAAPVPSPTGCDDLRETWGIEVVRLFATASGAMLDFRFRVIDPERAAPLFAKGTKAFLVDERTNRASAVPGSPKTGPFRTTGRPEAGRTYYMVFSNMDRGVRRGDPVSIVVGDVLIPDLTVE